MTFSMLQENDLRALTEVCSVGMHHAATALSQLMGKPVSIEVPRLVPLEPGALQPGEVTGLHLQILGNVRGSIVILLRQENARRLLELLLGKLSPAGGPLNELETSTLMEIGNILASACLNALGSTLKMTLLPSVPHLESGPAATVLAHALGHAPAKDAILMIDTVFSVGDAPCSGSILLIPATASLEVILGNLEAG